MKARGRSEEPGRGQRGTSRDSSVSSSGREVRCACQFFQTDSLLPERVTLVGRPPSRTSNTAMATQIGDHEYEPISPPMDPQQPPQQRLTMDPEMDVEMELGVATKREGSRASSTDSRERRFLRIPLDDELVMVPGDGEDEDAVMASRELGDHLNGNHDDAAEAADEDRDLSAQELQARMEERYFANTPTTESRTDCDVNTSQLDSSGLEDLPLKRDARKKKVEAANDKQSQARGLQQRIRSQAGRIRTKLRSMSRPKFSMPERPKFNLPERPKFNFPERPKFNLPERPKFNFPERPKFNLPERPKFNLPERPKFNLPERPKFNLPQRPKLSMPHIGISKSSTSPKKGTSSTRRPLRDRPSTLSSGSSSTKRALFDFDLKTYPRIFDRKSKHADYATSSPKVTRAQTPPPKMPSRRKGPVGSRWVHRFTDIKYADDENMPPRDLDDVDVEASGGFSKNDERMDISNEDRFVDDERDIEHPGSIHTESTTAFRDKDYGYALTMVERQQQGPTQQKAESIPESDREQRSSGSSSDRRRAGVLEEIDSDEFFLREKGLSQEDVDVGRYLTSEIRDAFRSPVSALTQMDKYEYYDDDEDVEQLGQRYRATPEREPTRPARTRSLRPRKRENKTKTPSPTQEKDHLYYNTFPPARPKRVRRQQQQQEEQPIKGGEEEDIQQEEEDEKEIIQHYTEKIGDIEAEVEAAGLEETVDTAEKRASPSITASMTEEQLFTEDQGVIPEHSEIWHAEDERMPEFHPPLAPKRKHRSRRELQSSPICNGHYTKEDWLENVQAQIETEEGVHLRAEPDYIIPASPDEEAFEEPPVPPKRGRRRESRGTSLVDEDRTSRGADSLPSEREPAPSADDLRDFADSALNEMGGYASVDKPSRPERPRRPKPPRPPPPGRRKRSVGQTRLTTNNISHFFSLPRRAIRAPPVRPIRNYSTLGPSRPPRRKVIEHEYIEQEEKSEAYMEIEDSESRLRQEDSHGSTRDLQSGDVIEKMKSRPLPPPPRPPRKGREAKDTMEEEDQEQAFDLETKVDIEPLGALSDTVFYARQEVTAPFTQIEDSQPSLEAELDIPEAPLASEVDLELEEVSVATQTDPLPDDLCVEAGDVEEPQEPHTFADASTETTPVKLEMCEIQQTVISEEVPPPQIPPPPPPEPTIIERPIPYYVMPDPDTEVELKAQRLQVSELDVERLNVGELQAQKILVSDIDGMSMQVAELSSKSGHLVVSGIELPSSFLQDLVDTRVNAAAAAMSSTPVEASTTTSSAPASSVHPETQSHPQTVSSAPEVPTLTPATAPAECTPSYSAPSPSSSASAQEREVPISVPPASPVPPVVPVATSVSTSLPSAPQQTDSQPASSPSLAAPTAIPLLSPIFLPHAVHSLQGSPHELLHSYIPEYIPSIPLGGRSSSRVRAHLAAAAAAAQRDLESDEEPVGSTSPPSTRRRRHVRGAERPPVTRSSSDDEDEEDEEYRAPSRRTQPVAGASASAATDPSVVELGRQLIQACHGAALRAVRHTLEYATAQLHDVDDKRRDLQIALCLLLVLVAGFILLGFGSGKTLHHHHWDFFFPPSR